MEEQGQGFNVQEKLDILQRTIPYFCSHLIPSLIVPKLGQLLTVELRNRILEKEDAGSREEAVKLLINEVIKERESGLNHFLFALRKKGDDPGWPQFLTPFEDGDVNVSDNDVANRYYAFIVHLLEGEIIQKLSDVALQGVLIELYSQEAIYDYEMEMVEARMRAKGLYSAAVQMFTLLCMRSDDWPLKFFRALQSTVPDVLNKMALFSVSPIADKESCEEATGGAGTGSSSPGPEVERAALQDSQEKTQSKQLLTDTDAQGPEPVGASGGANVSDDEKDRAELSADSTACGQCRVISEDSGSAASAMQEDADAGGAHFSDDEKYETEDSEKNQPGRKETSQQEGPRELHLRAYQQELAFRALQGDNTIICACTGSGKTRVALHIVQQHLMAAHQGEPRKVVFLARTVPLVTQQHRNFKEYLPQYKSELVTGESENSMTVHHRLDKNDILCLTPKILENHLRPDKIPSLSAFSLIIFDECHHTRKGEPYNSVMKHYLKSKSQGEQGLPQIVGLTASIGVEKATTPEEAKESILSIMGNLDVTSISEVRENVDELRQTVPRPEEELDTLVSRETDAVSNTITNIMGKIEEELTRCEQAMKSDCEIDEIRNLLHKRETDLRSQKYGQWAIGLRNQARLLNYTKTPQNQQEQEKVKQRQAFSWEVQVLADWLVAYNEVFDVHDLTRPEDVLHYLENKSKLQREDGEQFVSTDLVTKVRGYFTEVQKQLQKFRQQQNPNLEKLARIILQHIGESENDLDGFRILIFVRTRATCRALCRWLNSRDADKRLSSLNASHFTGTGAHQEQGGMTQYEQVETLKRFKQGDVKLLVTTSVGEEGLDIAECNLTIRYNHVGNEVTTVQTRGRSRKQGGRSILIAVPKIIEQEELNRKREELMYAALNLIRVMSQKDIMDFVLKVQRKTLEVEEIDQIMRQVKQLKKEEAQFSIACALCREVKVNGAQLRCINNAHRVITGHDIDDQVVVIPGESKKKSNWEMYGSVVCKCKHRLGRMLRYKKAQFIIASPKYWVFLDESNTPSSYKDWTSVPYHIKEVSPVDIKEHLENEGKNQDGSGIKEEAAAGPDTK